MSCTLTLRFVLRHSQRPRIPENSHLSRQTVRRLPQHSQTFCVSISNIWGSEHGRILITRQGIGKDWENSKSQIAAAIMEARLRWNLRRFSTCTLLPLAYPHKVLAYSVCQILGHRSTAKNLEACYCNYSQLLPNYYIFRSRQKTLVMNWHWCCCARFNVVFWNCSCRHVRVCKYSSVRRYAISSFFSSWWLSSVDVARMGTQLSREKPLRRFIWGSGGSISPIMGHLLPICFSYLSKHVEHDGDFAGEESSNSPRRLGSTVIFSNMATLSQYDKSLIVKIYSLRVWGTNVTGHQVSYVF